MYASATAALEPSELARLNAGMGHWDSGPCDKWRQVAANIRVETALSLADFVSLLKDFCQELITDPLNPAAGWTNACRRHQFRGVRLVAPIPECLGRATPLGNYAKIVSTSPSVGLSSDQCETLIRKVILNGAATSGREIRILRRARLGRYVVWATFHEAAPGTSPFDHFPKDAESVRTALGLGECSETETLILMTYRSRHSRGELALFRPTIAEAEAYSWYRPVSDATSFCGRTAPLQPNVAGLPPQPEVVHSEIDGETLVLPLYLAV